MESTAGNLVHLEEYVDTIVSLPHEIQRNLTMIREHDSQVQEMEKDIFVDIKDFMSLQSGKKEIPGEERIELIKRIKKSFLSTLTHCEEKVSLANQCYNSVERHLIKMEEDLKCFEEEIRLSGYSELLEKVRIERRRQREQVKNKKKQEALINASENESEDESEATGENEENSSEKEQQQQQQQQQQQLKKRKPANRNAVTPKKPRATGKPTTKSENSVESDEEAQMAKISRAERLLRRSKPAYAGGETANSAAAMERSKEDENQGDDEAEESEEEEEQGGENEEEIEGGNEGKAKEEPEEEQPQPQPQPQQQQPQQPQQLQQEQENDLPTRTSRRQSKPSPSTEQLYCTCNRDSFGEMIGCDAKDCPVEWFHYECVGLKSPPKGKWYCKGCQESMDAKTAAQLAVGISTRSSRRT